MSEELRMNAYYYSFDLTGERSVDVMLSALAWAGKAFHHTEDWLEPQTPRDPAHRGSTPIDWIQNAAIDVAAEITALRAALDQERADNAKLRSFAIHKVHCASFVRSGIDPRCTCGLTALLSGRGEAE